jgi:hypothetical protein
MRKGSSRAFSARSRSEAEPVAARSGAHLKKFTQTIMKNKKI